MLRLMRAALALAALSFMLPAAADAIPQGYYDSCNVASGVDVCAKRAELVGSAGYKFITASPNTATNTQLRQFTDRAYHAGVRVMWQLNWAAGQTAVTQKINVLKVWPGTWGYVLPDEPSLSEHAAVKAYADWARAADPNHSRWLNLLGDQALSNWSDVRALKSRSNYPINNQQPSTDLNWQIYYASRDNLAGYQGVVLQSWRIGDSWYDSGGCWCYTDSRWPTFDETAAAKDGTTRVSGMQFIMYFWLPDTAGWPPGTNPWYWATWDGSTGQRFETIRQGAMSGWCQWAGCT